MELHDALDEAYCGEWDSEEDFGRHIIEECYNLEKKLWAMSLGSSTTKPSDESCSCSTTLWAQTVTFSARSAPSLSPSLGCSARGALFVEV